ncbi:MAG: addiction module component [Burkholderiales bacterium]|nr:addiction module component [Burkholderiales bacterium]
MSFQLTLEEFLIQNNISHQAWLDSQCDWEALKSIAADHILKISNLQKDAAIIAERIQGLKAVHSVRSRVKDPEHLISKIIRRRAEGVKKYEAININNYSDIVTDLIGVRALHLFKNDCFDIDQALRPIFKVDQYEKPTVNYRKGDNPEYLERFPSENFGKKEQTAGYRSLHYILGVQILDSTRIVELQVRTIFEEGWSEIDHKVRYPNFSNGALVDYYLTIFNRLAGSADEMGSFVQDLVSHLRAMQVQIAEANTEKERSMQAMDDALKRLEQFKQSDEDLKQNIHQLRQELNQLRKFSSPTIPNQSRGLLDVGGINAAIEGALSQQKYIEKILAQDSDLQPANPLRSVSNIDKLLYPNYSKILDDISGASTVAKALEQHDRLNNLTKIGSISQGLLGPFEDKSNKP